MIIWNTFINETHRPNLDIIPYPKTATDNTTISPHINIIPDHQKLFTLEISTDGSILPDCKILTNLHSAKNNNPLHMTQMQPLRDSRPKHNLNTMLLN